MENSEIYAKNEVLGTRLALQKLQIKRLLEITQAINNNISNKDLFDMYRNTLSHEMQVGGFAFFVFQDGEWTCATTVGISDEIARLPINGELLAQHSRPNRIKDEEQDPLLREFDFILPVFHKKQALASVLLREIKADSEDLFEFVQFIAALTNIVAVALENKRLFKRQLEQERLKRDVELAVQVQNMLIPSHLPSNENYAFAGVYQPHEAVGGDYYDLIKISDDDIAFCIADISGKGVAAALLMANFQANLHALIHRTNIHVKKFIEELNAAVLRTTKGDKFITFFIARYNLSQRRLRYLCAGHNPPLLFSDGKIQRLDKGCTILGIFDKIPKIEMGEIYLDKDAFILLYTDGLTDLSNKANEYFDEEKLVQFISQNQDCGVAEFNSRLMAKVHEFKGENDFPDDISLLTGRIFVPA